MRKKNAGCGAVECMLLLLFLLVLVAVEREELKCAVSMAADWLMERM